MRDVKPQEAEKHKAKADCAGVNEHIETPRHAPLARQFAPGFFFRHGISWQERFGDQSRGGAPQNARSSSFLKSEKVVRRNLLARSLCYAVHRSRIRDIQVVNPAAHACSRNANVTGKFCLRRAAFAEIVGQIHSPLIPL